ncbi:MAG TPA: DNA double-strand break repair nuclease NurA [Rubricoccaceae bacterium]|nr:DNA double-strand break repair nuclease NurA [Rubricoccaceae bacterium]
MFLQLAENALTVAENLRGNYFHNTARFIAALRQASRLAEAGRRAPVLRTFDARGLSWEDLRGEVVTFLDGGIGQVQVASRVPILLRVGSYQVKTGERNLAEREQFGYYPVILGDLEGGSKERKDFVDIVRITAELLGGLAALKRTPDLRVLMFHGPLVYLVGNYAGHTPFTEGDINRFLESYAADAKQGRAMKEGFLHEAQMDMYPQMVPGRAHELAERRLFEPLAWMAYLYRQLVAEARRRHPVPIIAGVVERGTLSEFSRSVLLDRVFQGLRGKGKVHYFNEMFGRSDLTTPDALLNRLGYTDTLLLAMVLQPGEASEPWTMGKYAGLRDTTREGTGMEVNGEAFKTPVDWSVLAPPSPFGFPRVRGCYVCISETTKPVRVEVFEELGDDQIVEAARRVCLYSALLPGYGFPVGLDVADKYAKVPAWLTDAYAKLIRHHLGVSLQRGDVSDAEMRRLIVQAIYMTHRDWIFRPDA